MFDILCGGSKGGVYYFQNTGDKASPKFATAETLIPQVSDPTGSFIRRVPSRDGQPALPGSSYHIEPCDYDGDGDLDLLIGGRSSWLQPKVKKLTKEEKARVAELREKQTELRKQLTEASKRLSKAKDKGESESEKEASAAYAKVSQEFGALLGELGKLSPPPSKSGDFVWFYRRK